MSLQGPFQVPGPFPIAFLDASAFNFPFCKAGSSECSLSPALLLPVETVTPRREEHFPGPFRVWGGREGGEPGSPGAPDSVCPRWRYKLAACSLSCGGGGGAEDHCTVPGPTGEDMGRSPARTPSARGCPAQSSRRPAARSPARPGQQPSLGSGQPGQQAAWPPAKC